MAGVLIVIGILCIAYYLGSVAYAGFGVSMIWIWLAGGVACILLGGTMAYCRKHGIDEQIPFSVKCILQTGIACVLVLFLVTEGLICSGMFQKGSPNLDYIIVLGCQVKGKTPSKALKMRLETAREYLEDNPGTKAVLSGGRGDGEEISEAQCMYQYLTDAGIDESRLIQEDQSTTTVENLDFSKTFLEEGKDTVGIVTNNFHVYRSLQIAKKAGYMRSSGIAAPAGNILLPHYMVREFFALTKEIVQKNI
ncbi:MAG: YdcF family protein [Clostridiales bacterium]|nr:YdcF family protein [Clostridiales bacterium]